MGHKPPRAFGEENERDRLNGWCNEEERQRNPVGVLVHHIVCAVVHCCAYDGSNAELCLIDSKHDAT